MISNSLTFGRVLKGFIAIYGILVCIVLAIRAIGDADSTLIGIINLSVTLMLMPTLLLFPLCVVLRWWAASVALVIPFSVFLINYLPLFLPRISTPTTADTTRMSLLTYNIHAERNILQPMVEIIRNANADIVAIQEMSSEASATFDTQLADLYPHRALFPSPDGNPYHGRGLLSRFPISSIESWPVEYPLPVRLMRGVIDVKGTSTTVYNFHAPPSTPIYGQPMDFRPRKKQVGDVLAMIEQDTGAVVWLGDFNTNDMDPNYDRIVARMHDTFSEVGWGMGFTGPDWSHPQSQEGLPFIPIHIRADYIFHNDAFVPIEARVWLTSGGSDHRAVFAVLALKP